MLLAIDTSAQACAVAIYDKKIISKKVVITDKSKRHAETLDEMLDEVMDGKKWEDIKRIGVVTGPGSFTGVRVGLATARGLALALNIPCNGISAFQALAEIFSEGQPICCAIKLPTKKIATQCFDSKNEPISEPQVFGEHETKCPKEICRVAGSAAKSVKKNSNKNIQIINDDDYINIENIAKIISKMKPQNKPEPIYLREAIKK